MIFTFIGMPGCGKSCMGKVVSSRLKLPLIDSDKLIEKRFGKRLQAVLDEHGVDEFRRVEEDVLLSLKSSPDKHAILSTGGSAVYSKKAMDYLRTQGKVIYLYCSLPTVLERIKNPDDRGIVLKPGQTISDLYDERVPLYESAADITVSCDGRAYPKYQRELTELVSSYLK